SLCLSALHFHADNLLATLLEHVGAALEEQHPEDIFLELGGIHLAAQDVGGFEEVALQLGQGQWHGLPSRFVVACLPDSAVPDRRCARGCGSLQSMYTPVRPSSGRLRTSAYNARGRTSPCPVQLDFSTMRSPSGFPEGMKMRTDNPCALVIMLQPVNG